MCGLKFISTKKQQNIYIQIDFKHQLPTKKTMDYSISSKCPRYKKCSVNNCPLDLMYPNRITVDGDKENKCNMEKQVRLKIASESGQLKYMGLKIIEWSAKKRYDNMSDEEKELLKTRGEEKLKEYKKVKL